MTDDATLSDFTETDGVDEESDDDGDDGSDSEMDDADSGTGTGTAAIETTDATDSTRSPGDSGLSTYAWGEYTCSRCGAETDRVWRSDGELVCSGCKSW